MNFLGNVMNDTAKLSDLRISDGSFVYCSLNLLGSGKRGRGAEAATQKAARLQELDADIQNIQANMDPSILNNVGSTVQICADTVNLVAGAEISGILKNASVASLDKVLNDVSFKGGVASSHIKAAAEILLPAMTMCEQTERQLRLVRDLMAKRFEHRFTEQYLNEGIMQNGNIRGAVETVRHLRQAAASAAPVPNDSDM